MDAAAAVAGWRAEFVLRAGEDVEPELLAEVSALGSGTRAIGVYGQRWSEPIGPVLVYLHAVEDPGNVGTVIRSAHALADATVVLGPGCADPVLAEGGEGVDGLAVRAPARTGGVEELTGALVALDAAGERTLAEAELEPPLVLCLGSERAGLPAELAAGAVRIPVAADSLNVAMAATVALYEVAGRLALRMAADA